MTFLVPVSYKNGFLQKKACIPHKCCSHPQKLRDLQGAITLFLYKNQLYKNKEAQNDPKFKNKLRTTLASKSVNILRTSSERHPWCRLITIFLIEIRVLGLKGSWIFENLRAKSFLAVLSNNTRRLTLVRNQVFRYLINNTDP